MGDPHVNVELYPRKKSLREHINTILIIHYISPSNWSRWPLWPIQSLQACLKKILMVIFSSSLKIWLIFCVLSKLDHLAYNKFSKLQHSLAPLTCNKNSITLSHAKWSNLQNTQQNYTKFLGMLLLGEDEKMIREKFCCKIFNSDRASKKKLLSESGETTCISVSSSPRSWIDV